MMVMMLTLLIAIISEIFVEYNKNQENASLLERAKIIAENSYLIPSSVLKKHAQIDNKYLVIAS